MQAPHRVPRPGDRRGRAGDRSAEDRRPARDVGERVINSGSHVLANGLNVRSGRLFVLAESARSANAPRKIGESPTACCRSRLARPANNPHDRPRARAFAQREGCRSTPVMALRWPRFTGARRGRPTSAFSAHQRRRRDCCLRWPAAQSRSDGAAGFGGRHGRWFVIGEVLGGPDAASVGDRSWVNPIVRRALSGAIPWSPLQSRGPHRCQNKRIVRMPSAAQSHSAQCDHALGPRGLDSCPSKPIVPSRPSSLPSSSPAAVVAFASRRSRASTDVDVHRRAVPRPDVTPLDQRLPLRVAKRSPGQREVGRCRNSSIWETTRPVVLTPARSQERQRRVLPRRGRIERPASASATAARPG